MSSQIYKRRHLWYLPLKQTGADIIIEGKEIDGFVGELEEKFPRALQRYPGILKSVLEREVELGDVEAACLERVFQLSVFRFRLDYGGRDVIWDERDKFLAVFQNELLVKIEEEKLAGSAKDIVQKAGLIIEECFECR